MIIPYERGDIVSYLNDHAVVQDAEYKEDGVHIHANISLIDSGRYEQYIV